ncbi:MAG: BamA/TamA family outer membrane protein [Burkholderiales bacterium]|nr:BamA/TamA family outer membrane protein [Burkholderiales bacterium]
MTAVRILCRFLGVASLIPFAVLHALASQAEETADAAAFDVLEFVVDGNTVLEARDIERAVYPFLGPGKTIDDVESARAALESAYQRSGYLTVYVDVPEQEVKGGLVRLNVTEGTVDRLRVKGARYYSLGRIRQVMPALAEGEVPYFPDVQQQLASASRSADRKVTPVLKAAAVPGRVDIDLNVEDRSPVHGSIEINNRYTANTDPLRLLGAIRYDNLWQREHSASLQYLMSPEDASQVRVLTGTYVFNAGPGNNVLALYGVRSNSDVAAAGNITVVGRGTITGARYIIPLPTKGSYSHSFTLGVDYKDLTDSLALQGADTLTTPISYVPMSTQYSATQVGKRGVTQGNVSFNFAMRKIFGNQDSEFAARRFDAQANYMYVRADLSREQKLTRGYSVFVRVGGQMASQPLISSEQYFAGGVDSVRGYLEAEALGDDGVMGRLELRTPSFADHLGSVVNTITAHAFLEGAELLLQNPLPGQQGRTRLSSAGLGLRARGPRNLVATADLGWPFEYTRYTSAGDPRLQFRVAYDF